MTRPVPMQWDGEVMRPTRGFAALADKEFVVGEVYTLDNVDHLRKYALIKAGFRDERSIVCGSKAEAVRVGAFVKPMDDHAIVAVSEAVVRVYTAKSQSPRAMGRKVFQESKDAVLAIMAEMIDVSREQMLFSGDRDAAGGETNPAVVAA